MTPAQAAQTLRSALRLWELAKNCVMAILLTAGCILCLMIYLEVVCFIYWVAFFST